MLLRLVVVALFLSLTVNLSSEDLPAEMLHIMHQDKYQHASWGLYAKVSKTGEVLFDLNSDQMFLPASTTKLFSVAALLNAYGDNYRFKTPVYAVGTVKDGRLNGNLVLVGQGDLTFGGRGGENDQIAFTKLDHIIANAVPGVILTKGDPLRAVNDLAKQVREKGIQEITGDVLIDDRLFPITQKRDMILSPILINENLIDIIINPGEKEGAATMTWRPIVKGYEVKNEVKTVSNDGPLEIRITADEAGKNIVVHGTIPLGQKEIVRTFSIKDPSKYARAAFIQALRAQGITTKVSDEVSSKLPPQSTLSDLQPIAVWNSPPLSEYAKLILKVSHNVGADLIPLLLSVRKGKPSFDEGMRAFGDFVMNTVKLPNSTFVFIDGAGGDENRLTPRAEVQLLEYVRKLPSKQFASYYDALPILGVDGSMEDFGKSTNAVGKVRTKPGTGASFNTAANQFFLTTQALAGYIEGKNGQLIDFMVVVNNAQMPAVEDVFAIFEDLSQITGIIYESSTQP